ncbi:hypothetical protein PF049_12075 [Erythrobacteraceae bacterium WH01K]|nr:hypothetical protein PF049_12075 [Erythrobacteraceae bacterium WH01K]
MYSREFFRTRLGQAAMVSIVTMTAFVALGTQLEVQPAYATTVTAEQVELA